MGTNTLTNAVDGTIIPATDNNQFVTALKDNFVPRDTTTRAPADLAGDLGASSTRWKDAYIQKHYIGTASNAHTIQESGTTLVIDGKSAIDLKINGTTALQVDSGGLVPDSIGEDMIIDGNVTQVKLGAANYQISSACGTFSTTSTTPVDVTNLSVSLTTTGRPVYIGLIADGANASYISSDDTGVSSPASSILILRGSTEIARYRMQSPLLTTSIVGVPSSSVNMLDPITLGTYTYKIQVVQNSSGGTSTVSVINAKLVAYEL